MLSIKGLEKYYGTFEVLKVPELELSKGIYWVKGINGSGKTTLLKIIAGILPYRGKIHFNTFEITEHPVEYRTRVNYAEAEPLYPDFLTGKELLLFYNKVKGGDSKESEALAERFGMNKIYDKKVGTYSSGMCKKLSLVLAFVGNPELILLDEPLVTLDAQSVPVLSELIKEYHQREASFLITSHQSLLIPDLDITQELMVENKTVCFL